MHLLRGRWVVVLLAMGTVLSVLAVVAWKRQVPFEPFRVAGNLYYVGTDDVTSFLLTGPQGHVLIDGG